MTSIAYKLVTTFITIGTLSPTVAIAAGPSQDLLKTTMQLAGLTAATKAFEELGTNLQEQWASNLAPGESLYSIRFSFSKST